MRSAVDLAALVVLGLVMVAVLLLIVWMFREMASWRKDDGR